MGVAVGTWWTELCPGMGCSPSHPPKDKVPPTLAAGRAGAPGGGPQHSLVLCENLGPGYPLSSRTSCSLLAHR